VLKILFNVKTVGHRRSCRHCRLSCSLEAKDNTASLWYSLRKARENAGLFPLLISCLEVVFLGKKKSSLLYEGRCWVFTSYLLSNHGIFKISTQQKKISLAESRCVTALYKYWGNKFLGSLYEVCQWPIVRDYTHCRIRNIKCCRIFIT